MIDPEIITIYLREYLSFELCTLHLQVIVTMKLVYRYCDKLYILNYFIYLNE